MKIKKIKKQIKVEGECFEKTEWWAGEMKTNPDQILYTMFASHRELYRHLGIPEEIARKKEWHPGDDEFNDSCVGFREFLKYLHKKERISAPTTEALLEAILDGKRLIEVEEKVTQEKVWRWNDC